MGPLAAAAGRFVGAALDECAPTLVRILSEAIRDAFAPTVEDGHAPDDLVARLRERVRDANRSGPERPAGPTP